MHILGDDLILATTDLTKFVRCDHATWLDHSTKTGDVKPLAMRPPSPIAELLSAKGDEHEHRYVDSLRANGAEVVVIEHEPWSIVALQRGEAATLDAMRRGAPFISQAAFFDGRWSGYADLLERTSEPSSLGAWSYEVVDTKLARETKAHFILQLSDYSRHVSRLQGSPPERMHVLLGTGRRDTFRVGDFDAYYRHVRSALEAFVDSGAPPVAYPVPFCDLCTWGAHCRVHWSRLDHLSLVANIRRTQVNRLESAGINTLTALAESRDAHVERIPAETYATLNHQARLQLQQRRTGELTREPLPLAEGRGFNRLPRATDGDVFLDLEGDPFAGDGLTYLFGVAWETSGGIEYRAWWAHDAEQERRAFENVVDFITERRKAAGGGHVYHYGAIETATLKRLAGHYGTRESELDDLLRCEAFVDLSAVVRQGLRIGQSSYGLKAVEEFYFTRESKGVRDAGGAIVAYEKWVETGNAKLLEVIEEYNREDCVSTLELRRWLVHIRPDAASWKEPQEPRELTTDRISEEQQNDALFQRLNTAGLPLLADLLYYHRREERPAWWKWFDRRDHMTDEELIHDGETIGGLRLDTSVAAVREKQSTIFTYTFPPQEHKFDAGDNVNDRRNKAGQIVDIDDVRGIVRLKRGPKVAALPHPDALIPDAVVSTVAIRAALRRFATTVADHGIDGTPYRAAADILVSRPPRLLTGSAVTDVAETAARLDDSYLFVQGPPGSGKTRNGARAIVALLRAGRRIGVTSNSHKAIHWLLHEIEEVAASEGYWFRGVKKSGSTPDSIYRSNLPNPMVEPCGDNSDCADRSLPLVAGTAWVFSDEAIDRSLDYLFVDEAGQMALATALAVSTAARNVVLLGDPLQLAQVSQAAHPDHAGNSVLEHLLGESKTVAAGRGIFLERSWRMHPDVCRFVSEVVYDSRLESAPECANQRVTIGGKSETGLRFAAVAHEGNSQSSHEEATRIADEISRILTGTFTSSRGVTQPMEQRDVLVVAAYNAQVRTIARELVNRGFGDVPVGTVDKFQGREAPVVFFSMATSSGADLPRDIDFLFSRNRLNVAISRARCLSIVVANPRLLDVDCRTPAQMRLVNALCRYVELARPV
jgi:predicted RecB family nuclease